MEALGRTSGFTPQAGPGRRRGAAVVLIAGGAFAFANRGGGEDVVNIATKPMTEQYILGEMLNTLIEHDTDLKVELTQGVGGGTSNIEPGMEKGDFDLYPEYTERDGNAVLKHDDTYDESMFDHDAAGVRVAARPYLGGHVRLQQHVRPGREPRRGRALQPAHVF